jgi:hypothetical protein
VSPFVDTLKKRYQMVIIGDSCSLEIDALTGRASAFYVKNT